jgi:hypothetical protein
MGDGIMAVLPDAVTAITVVQTAQRALKNVEIKGYTPTMRVGRAPGASKDTNRNSRDTNASHWRISVLSRTTFFVSVGSQLSRRPRNHTRRSTVSPTIRRCSASVGVHDNDRPCRSADFASSSSKLASSATASAVRFTMPPSLDRQPWKQTARPYPAGYRVPGRGRRSPPGDGLPGGGDRRCWRGGVVGGGWGGLPDPAIRDDADMAQTDPGGVYDAEHAENGRWAWFWTSPGGATFDSAAIYASKEAALYAARAWVKRRYKG